MKRQIYKQLLEWKEKPSDKRKPLVLRGARQVGKTWILRALGKQEFENVIEINFEQQRQLSTLFEVDFDTTRILRSIEIVSGQKAIPGKTLIIFDEIQAVERGLLSLKYLHDSHPEYHIVAAGSLLGISLHQGASFPVGKVEFLDLYPLSLEEFMSAIGKENMVELLHSMDWDLITHFKAQFIDILRQYYYVGGMPEVVKSYAEEKDFTEVRKIQNALLQSYDLDFSKHPPVEIIPRLKMVWDNIPAQLAKENKKFIYSALRQGARAKEFELAIEWLKEAGVIHKTHCVNNISMPLDGFADFSVFKIYLLDVGLLAAKSGLDAGTIIDGNKIFAQYKGALTEQFVLQQLLCHLNTKVHYWSSKTGMAEIDFLLQHQGKIIPIEVKAEENLQAKSLKSYIAKYTPSLAIRTSLSSFRKEEHFTNVPLYAITLMGRILEEV